MSRHCDTDSQLADAFFRVCRSATHASPRYVSLYVSTPFYGGPEEGGWWGHDNTLVATQQFSTEDAAEMALSRVRQFAEHLSQQARTEYGEYCLRTMEWLENRGLDADYLPEVDGESHYFAVVEEEPGSHTHHGCRHYE